MAFSGAQAQTAAGLDGAIEIELNRLEQVDQSCRVYMPVKNATEEIIEKIRIDFVIYDNKEIIINRLFFGIGPIQVRSKKVGLFDLSDTDCLSLKEFLVNGVVDCDLQSGPRDDCESIIRVSSKAEAALTR